MAKIIIYHRKKGKQISQLLSWQNERKVFILQMKKAPDDKPHRDHLAALELGLKLKQFTLVKKDTSEVVWGIEGSLKKLAGLQVRIGKAAYEIVKREGGGKRRDRSPKERWHFST